MVDSQGSYVGHEGGVDGGEERPLPAAALVLDGHNGGDARKVEQDEDKLGQGSTRRHVGSEGGGQMGVSGCVVHVDLFTSIHHRQCAYHQFLGTHT